MKRYPAYKESRLTWLGEIPAHWEERRARFYFREVNEHSQTGDEELLSVSHITGVTPRSEKNISMFKAESYVGYKLCQPGDLVVNSLWTWMAALGVAWESGIVSIAYSVYRPKSNQLFNPKYLDQLVRIKGYAGEYLIRSKGVWTSRLGLNTNDFYDIPMFKPPSAEQSAIVAFLDRKLADIDRYIANKQKQIELLQEQKTAIINRAVTQGLDPNVKMKPSGIEWLSDVPAHWEVMRIGKLAESLQTGPFGSQLHQSDYVPGGIPIVNPTHMKNRRVVPEFNSAVSKQTWERLQRHALSTGDIVFARRGELGRCILITSQEEGWLCGSGSMRMRLKQGIADPEFLSIVLSTNGVAEYLSLSSVGSTMDNLNTGILARLSLPIPPITEQKTLVGFINAELEKIALTISTVEREIELMQEYRTALIAEAVTGKIDVRMPADQSAGNETAPRERG